MIRLTFREKEKFGVVGMNEANQDKKLYSCVLKLIDYEDTGLSPNDILKLKEELEEKDKKISKLQANYQQVKTQLEKVNGILTDIIIEVTENEFDLNKLCYLEEISAKFCEKMQEQINSLKGKELWTHQN